MTSVYDELTARGLIGQSTHDEAIRERLAAGPATFYIGFDPTADSLHVGHFLTIMAMARMQRAGHRPIALIGGGTAMIGDPTGKTDMRRVMTREEIDHNASRFKDQLGRFLDFGAGGAIMVNNADWLADLNYIGFLREVGSRFSVNRMLTAECYKARLEKGLTFLEFNYMLMQSYDFLTLYRKYGCQMQLGGNDQWSNIIGGIELIRRAEGAEAFGLTFTLLTTSAGKKMGKTESGAVWLDSAKTSPHEFFQYWRNVDDADVKRCLYLLTFLPGDDVESVCAADINRAKETLAYELTAAVHSRDDADRALAAARALFGGGSDGGGVPATEIPAADYPDGIGLIDALMLAGLCASRGEGRRLIAQGGVSLNGVKAENDARTISPEELRAGVMIRKGKKIFHKMKFA
ncbi:MAG: tyrosine--tRNA ligase [Clostridiales bacterium]|jgi:tyrosyl-tRNA synthetase|nr:tyrosine--tRNA ligase [Clostridiales bacterium]